MYILHPVFSVEIGRLSYILLLLLLLLYYYYIISAYATISVVFTIYFLAATCFGHTTIFWRKYTRNGNLLDLQRIRSFFIYLLSWVGYIAIMGEIYA
jgi:Na+/proline symporter